MHIIYTYICIHIYIYINVNMYIYVYIIEVFSVAQFLTNCLNTITQIFQFFNLTNQKRSSANSGAIQFFASKVDVVSDVFFYFVIPATLCKKSLSHFCNNFLSHCAKPTSLCNKFLWHFVITTDRMGLGAFKIQGLRRQNVRIRTKDPETRTLDLEPVQKNQDQVPKHRI